jgi:hypothetical protein
MIARTASNRVFILISETSPPQYYYLLDRSTTFSDGPQNPGILSTLPYKKQGVSLGRHPPNSKKDIFRVGIFLNKNHSLQVVNHVAKLFVLAPARFGLVLGSSQSPPARNGARPRQV